MWYGIFEKVIGVYVSLTFNRTLLSLSPHPIALEEGKLPEDRSLDHRTAQDTIQLPSVFL